MHLPEFSVPVQTARARSHASYSNHGLFFFFFVHVKSRMKVKAWRLYKSQQAFKGDGVFLMGTETRHRLPFGISCRLQKESVFSVPETALLYLLLFIVRFTSTRTRAVTTPAP